MENHKMGMFNNEKNDIYHLNNGFTSSSALSLMIDDPTRYFKKYIEKSLPQEHKDCFDLGNAFHTKLLEPANYDKEFTTWGSRRSGPEWKKFEKENEGKIILANKQILEFDTLIKAVNKNKLATGLLDGGKSELSVYFKLDGFKSKVRFDKVNFEAMHGLDLKSTTGDLIGERGKLQCQQTIRQRNYDLSAAYYLDTLNALRRHLGKKEIFVWYWIFASKEYPNSRIFQASELMLDNGRKKYKRAIELIQKYEKNNWKVEDFENRIELLDPISADLLDGSEGGVASWN